MRGLYPIVDVDALDRERIPVVDFAARLLQARPRQLQLRAKRASPRDTLALLRALRPLCTDYGALLFANDRADLALMAGCDGVHVGQQDLPIGELRRVAPTLRIGLSTHDLGQLRAGLSARPAYVSYGPVFPTRSKANPDPVVGLEGLVRAAAEARAAGCPLVAIGGIDLAVAPSVAQIGAMGAVIAALRPPSGQLSDVTDHAQALHAALGGD